MVDWSSSTSFDARSLSFARYLVRISCFYGFVDNNLSQILYSHPKLLFSSSIELFGMRHPPSRNADFPTQQSFYSPLADVIYYGHHNKQPQNVRRHRLTHP